MTIKKIEKIEFWDKIDLILLVILMVTSGSIRGLFEKGVIDEETLSLGTSAIKTIFIFVGTLIIAKFIFKLMLILRRAKNASKGSTDELFAKIDRYRGMRCSNKRDDYYEIRIGLINYYYGKGGAVDKLVANKELTRLYERKDYLKKKKSYDENLQDRMLNLISAFLFLFLGNFSAEKFSPIIYIITISVSVLGFSFFLVFLPFMKKRTWYSDDYQVDEYELKLLEEKIQQLSVDLCMSITNIKLLEMKEIIFEQLRRKKKNTFGIKKRKMIAKDIEYLKSLEVCIEEDINAMKRIQIGDEEAWIPKAWPLQEKDDKKTNKSEKIINKQVAGLVDIMRNNGWI